MGGIFSFVVGTWSGGTNVKKCIYKYVHKPKNPLVVINNFFTVFFSAKSGKLLDETSLATNRMILGYSLKPIKFECNVLQHHKNKIKI